jgi:hypothetical protein
MTETHMRQRRNPTWRWLTNRPVGYGASLLLGIRKITLFGKWPALLGNRSVR